MADMINTTAPKTRERWLDVLKLLAAYHRGHPLCGKWL